MGIHARLSSSSSGTWLVCPASPILSATMPNTTSNASLDGTAKHFLAEHCIDHNFDAKEFIGSKISIDGSGECQFADKKGQTVITVTKDFADQVQYGLDVVRSLGGYNYTEVTMDISRITGEPNAKGTSDIVNFKDDMLTIADYKFGRLKVSAFKNPQLMIYAMAALIAFKEIAGHITKVKLLIIQPALDHVDSHIVTIDELKEFYREVIKKSSRIMSLDINSLTDSDFSLGDKQCKYCKAKPICPAFNKLVDSINGVEPLNDKLADSYTKIELLRGWCDAVETLVKQKLESGEVVGDLELATGKPGNRKWVDEDKLIELLRVKKQNLDVFKKESMISPADVDKLFKKKLIDEELYEDISSLVIRPQGKPVIKQKASVLDDFEDLS